MGRQKIFILLPDGVGLRNFAFTEFYNLGKKQGFDIVFWNSTKFDLVSLGFKEIKIDRSENHPFTNFYKNARKQIELNISIRKSGDPIFNYYRFPFSYKNVKSGIKSLITQSLIYLKSSESGLRSIRKTIKNLESKTEFYQKCLQTLIEEKPAMVFCTNQRHSTAIAPLLAAQDLGIPTATFIFSWDNLPKATMAVETDYYFVWSDYMKEELLYYYSYILQNQILVTGTPQFECHFDKSTKVSKADFFLQHRLDNDTKYICYSGDDVVTSPNDPDYLSDVAKAIRQLNSRGFKLGIIFRRCPVDISDRYRKVLEENTDIIVSVDPRWKRIGAEWSSILPEKEDLALLASTIEHSEIVINLGSSMVFDGVAHGKPSCYINYNSKHATPEQMPVETIYQYVHFRSMTSKECVVLFNNPEEISERIEKLLEQPKKTVEAAEQWFQKINLFPPEHASDRIWNGISEIVKNT